MLSKLYRFIVFVIYQRSIKVDFNGNDSPKVKTAWGISWLQIMLMLLIFFITAILGEFSLRKIKEFLFLTIIIISIYNYRICVKRDYLDKIKVQFEGGILDNKRNSRIVMVSIATYFVLFIFLIGLSSYLKFGR